MERLSFEETAFFSIYIQLVKPIFDEGPLHTPRKETFDEKSPISRSKVKGLKLLNNSPIFSEESFEFKKITSNEHGHIHKASESTKNPF